MSKRRSIKSLVKGALDGARASGVGPIAHFKVNREGEVVVFVGSLGGGVTAYTNPWDEVLRNAENQKRAS